MELVITGLEDDEESIRFRDWLQTLVPWEGDEENGYGGFIRKESGEHVQRWLDLRELTERNQQLFRIALQNSLNRLLRDPDNNKEEITLVQILLRMQELAEMGADPGELTDWKDGYVEPASHKKVGPGW